jgi:hypothetical protein
MLLCSTLCLASPAEAVSGPYQGAAAQADDTIAFDIPAQPLLAALRSYSELTGQAVLVDDALAAGRRACAIHGRYNKIDALQKLLAGTGLVASYSSDQAFTLKLAEPDATVARAVRETPQSLGAEENQAVLEHYAGKIQQPIEAALCRSAQTRPGTYRLALQIWIAPSGRIEKTHWLSPIGSQRGDEVRRVLNGLALEPPPAGMPQPITLLLLPKHAADVPDCAASSPSVH